MDFNPWRSDEDTLYLSVALFSQFHCKKPIYTHDDKPFVGPWDQRDRLFREAAEAMERAVVTAMASEHSGDGFEPIAANVATVSWASLGLALPPRPAGEKRTRSAAALPLRWRVVENAAEPMILFRFAPPLDSYAGEATHVSGTLTLGPNRELGRMRGGFEVATDSVTMGEPDLDDALRGAVFLHAERHPTAGFTIDGVTTDVAKLAYNQPARVTLAGTFKMKGVAIPLNVRAQLEPFVEADGSPGLSLTASFRLDLRAFDIEGADGPAPANHTLLFDVSFRLAPAKLGRD